MLELKNITLQYDNFQLNEIFLQVEKGSYFCLLGESGSGKSLLLELIGGIIKPATGSISWNQKDITGEVIQKRPVSLMFQDFALFPHKTVYQNLIFAFSGNKISDSEISDNISELTSRLKIDHLLQRKPGTLSEGEQQRVALCRAILNKKEVLLLDEPMASLDVKIKPEIKGLLRELNRKGQTIIHITHDFEEVLSLSDSMAIMSNGRIIDQGKTLEVFRQPRSEFVARLKGYKNFFKTEIRIDKKTGEKTAWIDSKTSFVVKSDIPENKGFILIYDSDIILSENKLDSSACNNFLSKIVEIYPSPAGYEVKLDIGIELFASVTTESVKKLELKTDKKIWVSIKATAIKFFNYE